MGRFRFWCGGVVIGLGALAGSVPALTIVQDASPEFVRQNAQEFGVKVTKGKAGMIDFTIRQTLKERRYLVAHLTVSHEGKVIVESSTPSYGAKGENLIYFSIRPEDAADSEFELSCFGVSGDNIPVVGSLGDYKFGLRDFVPGDLLKEGADK